MITVTAKLESVSPYSQSKFHETEKLDKESPADFEKRTWRNKMHVDENDELYIPPMAFKNCLAEAAKYLSISIPGKGKATYTKHIEAGVLVTEPMPLGIKVGKIEPEVLFLPSDGQRGGSKRVKKYCPLIPKWSGSVVFYVFDETVTKDVFKHILEEAGKFIGLGRFRPRNNGYYGRFVIKSFKWDKMAKAA